MKKAILFFLPVFFISTNFALAEDDPLEQRVANKAVQDHQTNAPAVKAVAAKAKGEAKGESTGAAKGKQAGAKPSKAAAAKAAAAKKKKPTTSGKK